MRLLLFADAMEHLVYIAGGLPPKRKRPSSLFEQMGYSWGDVAFGASRLKLSFDDVDYRLWDSEGIPTRVELANGDKIVVAPRKEAITIEAIFMSARGEYVAICTRGGAGIDNHTITDLRLIDSRAHTRRRAFPGIPTSDN